uniref:hypothetical protein n=1 Tax=Porodaedalea chrysoloma TaxID=74615 RepID=UPI0023AA86BF|nr:hypothetical protein P1S03_mgp04 [Porodaedalea chrysoloma]WCF76802.1 hypothetical protein [Porodaedalea chrysoloma]
MMNNNNLKIIASIAKISSKSSGDLNNFVASVIRYPRDVDINSLSDMSVFMSKNTDFFKQSKFVVLEFSIWESDKEELVTENIKYFRYNLYSFYRNVLNFNSGFLSDLSGLIRNISFSEIKGFPSEQHLRKSGFDLGNFKDLLIKDSMSYNNIIFIFNGIAWCNIVYLFKSLNISIYGGSGSRRHLLSTVQSSLVKFLLLLDNMNLDPNIVYNSFTDLSTISGYFNRKILDLDVSSLTNENFLINESENLVENYKFVVECNVTMKAVLSIFDMLKNINQLELAINKHLYDISEANNRKHKYELSSSYSSGFKLNKIDNALKIIRDTTIIVNNLTSKIELLKVSIKEEILKLYKYNSEMFFTVAGYYRADGRIRVVINDDNKELLSVNNIIIESSCKDNSIKDNKLDSSINLNNNHSSNNGSKRFYSTKVEYKNNLTIDNNPLLLNKNSSNKLLTLGVRNYSILSNKSLNNKILFNKNIIKCSIGRLNFSINSQNSVSIFSKDSVLYNKIMTSLYSGHSLEEIQLNIEKYLLDKNLLSETELSDGNLNYKLLNKSLIESLNESKLLLTDLYNNYKKERSKNLDLQSKVLLNVNKDYIINVCLGRLLRIISNNDQVNENTLFTSVAIDLGKEIVNRYNYENYIGSRDGLTFNNWKQINYTRIIDSENATEIFNIGTILIGWLKVLNLIETKIKILSRIEKRNILIVGSKLVKLLPKGNLPILNYPTRIPMICPPKPYKLEKGQEYLGGYLLNDVSYTQPLIIENSNLVKQSKILDNNIIYDMVNNISSVAFSINQKVLDFILKNYKKYNLIIDPDFVHDLNNKTKLSIQESKELESFNSIKRLESNILGLANIFRNVSKFYIPVRLDYRGRIYCSSEYLNYQSVELAKALLQFAEGDKVFLTDTLSINYLKIFGANCFGNKIDKLSFLDRIKWVDENKDNIIHFENGELISKAENKLLFIAFCFEYNNFLEAETNKFNYFISKLPIQLDATCNGFQHLTLLLNDLFLSVKLNLAKSTWEDKPNDFYSFIALKIHNFFTKELEINLNLDEQTRDSYRRCSLLSTENNRMLFKKALMVIPYNATAFSIINYLKDQFNFIKKDEYRLKNNNKIMLKEIDFINLNKALNLALFKDSPKLLNLLNYFKDVAKIANKLGIFIPWTLPSGLNVQQQFFAIKKVKVKPFIYTKDLLTLQIYDKNAFNMRKQLKALMPNLVHSLDAASLALLIDNYFKEDTNKNFFAVHDCFAVTCNNVGKIISLLKLSYLNIYSDSNYILKFDKEFLDSIINLFGPDCYSEKTRIIKIINEKDEILELKYPNINEVIDTLNTTPNFNESSYLIS